MNYMERLANIDTSLRKLIKGKQDKKIYINETGIKSMLDDLTTVIIELEGLYTSIHEIVAEADDEKN